MDVPPPSSGAAGQTARAGRTAAAEDGKSAFETATGDFQTFLTLLTAQLRNQDPLKPTESTEFVAQLATFAGVEQQVRANDRLGLIHEALGGGASASLAAWIGTEVRAAAQAPFSGAPVTVLAAPAEGADRAVLTVTDDFGRVVARREASATATSLTWDGKDALGESQPYGLYSFAIESYAGEDLIATRPGEVFARVTEVRIEDGAPALLLEGGAKAAVGDVTALR